MIGRLTMGQVVSRFPRAARNLGEMGAQLVDLPKCVEPSAIWRQFRLGSLACKRQLPNGSEEYFVLMELCSGGHVVDLISKRGGKPFEEASTTRDERGFLVHPDGRLGQDRSVPLRFTAIWAKRASGLEFVSWQSTGIPPR